ncbi:hypothetical protein [Herbaspirillum sp. 1130]|uniref:hypothetical protein n=1 Tax=Herbaspirillum sp. 1130 TaxID=2806562 RepID=UPI001AE43DEA|nr:hypothetical protein [Herbaspirillum sp. 1130]MBP1317109.1 hypothetical protein [Herbaspirillum sp. 1130]
MKEKLTWVEVGLILICFAGALVCIAMAFAYFSRTVDKDKIGDAATWFGGMATALALGWAIWLSTSDQRARRRAEYDAAFIRWVELRPKVEAVYIGLDPIRMRLVEESVRGSSTLIDQILKDLELMRLWEPSDVTPLLPLDEHVAVRLVSVQVNVLESIRMLREGLEARPKNPAESQQVALRALRPLTVAAAEIAPAWDVLSTLRARGFGASWD